MTNNWVNASSVARICGVRYVTILRQIEVRVPIRDHNIYAKHSFNMQSFWQVKTHHYIIFFDHDILSQLLLTMYRTNYQGRPNSTIISQMWPSCWLWGILIMVGCVLSQLKPSGFSILSCEKGLGLRPRTFFTTKNGELYAKTPV